jgi:hypothetical protein
MRRHSTVEVGRAEVCDRTVPHEPRGNRPRESSYGTGVPVIRSDHRHHLRNRDVGNAEQGSSAKLPVWN